MSRERMRMRKAIEGEERHIYSPKPLGFSDKVGHVGYEAAVLYGRYGVLFQAEA
jgi:hypothetical protein